MEQNTVPVVATSTLQPVEASLTPSQPEIVKEEKPVGTAVGDQRTVLGADQVTLTAPVLLHP